MSISTEARDAVEVIDLDDAGARDLFDRLTRHHMDLTGAEFLARWDAGDYENVDWDEIPGLVAVTTSLPLVRH